MRMRTGIKSGVWRSFRQCHIARRLHELRELTIGDRRGVDPEIIDANLASGRSLGIMVVCSHPKGAAGNGR